MKNVDDLIESATELAERGLSKGEIADELNVSRETASWLVERSGDTTVTTSKQPSGQPDDIHVDWSNLGQNSTRIGAVGTAIADIVAEHGDIDLVVGIEKAGVPLATAVARELESQLATYAPRKHQWEEGDIEDLGGTFSRNFAQVDGRNCFVVDDTITSGTTMRETIQAITEQGGTAVAGAVVVDKRGVDSLEEVPIESLLQVIRVSKDEE